MRFQVPQFIEVEDKIFGPLTLKQFIYLAGGVGISFIIYKFFADILPFFILIVVVLPILAFSVALAFFKVNSKPFIFVVENAFHYFVSPKLYLWRKEDRPAEATASQTSENGVQPQVMVPKISQSKLKDLTWSLDIKESMYSNNNQR